MSKNPPKVPHLVWHWNPAHARPEKFSPVPFPSLAEARAAVASAKLREVAYVNATTGEMTDSEGVHRSRVPTYVKAIKEHFAKIGVEAPSAAPVPSPAVAPTIRPPAPAARTTAASRSRCSSSHAALSHVSGSSASAAAGAGAGTLVAGLASGAAVWISLLTGIAAVRNGSLDGVALAYAWIIALGFISIPLAVLTGCLK